MEIAEFNYKWHTQAPDPETADKILRELARVYGMPEEGYSRLDEPVKKETFLWRRVALRPKWRCARHFGQALIALGREYPKIVVLDADLNTSSKTVLFKKAFPDRFFQIGIAEQNLFGIAAGMALEGFIPFPSTFAVFATRRALDQIAISICYPRLKVLIPGSYVGLPTSRAGASHNCIEDIAVMRTLPNMRVADPGDNADLRADHAHRGRRGRPRLFPRHPSDAPRHFWSGPPLRMGQGGHPAIRDGCHPVRDRYDVFAMLAGRRPACRRWSTG